jgi:hypothetical protein
VFEFAATSATSICYEIEEHRLEKYQEFSYIIEFGAIESGDKFISTDS